MHFADTGFTRWPVTALCIFPKEWRRQLFHPSRHSRVCAPLLAEHMLPTCESVQGSFLYKGLMNSYVLIESLDAERCTVFPLQSIPKNSKIPHPSNIITEMEPIESECPHRLPHPQTPKLIPEIYSQVGIKGHNGH